MGLPARGASLVLALIADPYNHINASARLVNYGGSFSHVREFAKNFAFSHVCKPKMAPN